MVFDLARLAPPDKQYYLQHVVGPRPICFASTIDKEGCVNLSPFSFFNIFSAHPPVVIFSPARRLRDNNIKHTLINVGEVPEVVINMVTYPMVQQVSLSSCEYPRRTDEFIKAGFTKEPATIVRPPMVKESPVKMECRVREIKSLGEEGGSGQLVICEVLVMHIDDTLLDESLKMDQQRLDLVARLGGDWYCRVTPNNLFKVAKPNRQLGIGLDGLPERIRNSTLLSGNDLGLLANVETIPKPDLSQQSRAMASCKRSLRTNGEILTLHHLARYLLRKGNVEWAWQVLLLEQ